MRIAVLLFTLLCIKMDSFSQPVRTGSSKQNTWVFIMAGQSNMAGRGTIEPQDTIASPRVFSINAAGQLIRALEPLHFYEPTRTGLDCGMSFAFELLKHIPDSVNLLIIPTAIGGSSLRQWLGDSLYRGVHLLTNFREKAIWAQQYGQIKGIIWHQGESEANSKDLPFLTERLNGLFKTFRTITGNSKLPVVLGELGSYSTDQEIWNKVNAGFREYVATDPHSALVGLSDLSDGGDKVHFNAAGLREMGKRFAQKIITFIQ